METGGKRPTSARIEPHPTPDKVTPTPLGWVPVTPRVLKRSKSPRCCEEGRGGHTEPPGCVCLVWARDGRGERGEHTSHLGLGAPEPPRLFFNTPCQVPQPPPTTGGVSDPRFFLEPNGGGAPPPSLLPSDKRGWVRDSFVWVNLFPLIKFHPKLLVAVFFPSGGGLLLSHGSNYFRPAFL